MMRLGSDLSYEGKLIRGTPPHMRRACYPDCGFPIQQYPLHLTHQSPWEPWTALKEEAKRLNVALSHVKDGMFVTGSIKCLQDAATWSAIAWCKDRNLITDLHFFDSTVRAPLQL
ncbi:hypothetical protein Aduo_009344 [Ancylostoma duodenale]